METNAYFWLIVLTAFVVSVLGGLAARRRRKPLTLRQIGAYQMMPLTIDEAIESDRRVHFSLGGAAIGQPTTLAALAALTLVYEMTKRQAFTSKSPLLTLTDGVTLPFGQDTIRRAYTARNNVETFYHANAVIWYPQSERSLAFGAGVGVLNTIENVSSNIALGTFGAEIAFIGEASARRNSFFIGHSTDLTGQAIVYAQSENPLIGEELFVGDAYLDPSNSGAMGRVIALDVLRWVIIIAIILVAVFE